MSMSVVRIGIAGCGLAARIHLDRLLALENVEIAGCADSNLQSARSLADRASLRGADPASSKPVPAYSDHRDLLRHQALGARDLHAPSHALPRHHGCPSGRLSCVHRKAADNQFPGGR